jgi:hypothetical protein
VQWRSYYAKKSRGSEIIGLGGAMKLGKMYAGMKM